MSPIWLSWMSSHHLFYGLHGFDSGDHTIFYAVVLKLAIVIDLRDFRFHLSILNFKPLVLSHIYSR